MTVPSMFSMNRAVAMMKAVRRAERIGGFQVEALWAGPAAARRRRAQRLKAESRGHNRRCRNQPRPPQPPNTTLFMIRPGASVNKPVTTSARVKIQIIAER